MPLLAKEQRRERRKQTCKHFTGIMNPVCEVGISYRNVRDETQSPYTFACFEYHNCVVECPKREFFTDEEILAEEERSDKALAEYLKNLTEGICPTHKIKITKQQVGRCVYAVECGCRLYQGKI